MSSPQIKAVRLALQSQDFRSAAFHAAQAALSLDQFGQFDPPARQLATLANLDFLIQRGTDALDSGNFDKAAWYFEAAEMSERNNRKGMSPRIGGACGDETNIRMDLC